MKTPETKALSMVLPPTVKASRVGLQIRSALTLRDWSEVGRALRYVNDGVQWWVGDWANYGEKRYGDAYAAAIEATGFSYGAIRDFCWVAGAIELSSRNDNVAWSVHKAVAPLDVAEQKQILRLAEDQHLTVAQVRALIRGSNVLMPAPEGRYRCLVIDPPWPMQTIAREKRPDQHAMPYPVLPLEEIGKIPVQQLAAEDGCHVFLWVTQKFLPAGLDLFRTWGVEYECLLTWVKNVGFTPFSFMYSTEHVLFGRVGNLKLQRLGLRLDFAAQVTRHSEKPDVFFDLVRSVSPENRLEMFQRPPHEGFEGWGKESYGWGKS